MFHSIVKAYRAVDGFLIDCEDYFDLRIRTGKFVTDLQYLSWLFPKESSEKYKKYSILLYYSKPTRGFLAFLNRFWVKLKQISFFENSITVVLDGIHLLMTYAAEMLTSLL